MRPEHRFGSSVVVNVSGPLALLTFDRGVNRNAIDQETLLSLTEATSWLDQRADIHVVILTGARDHFSAGIDLKDPAKWQDENASLLERRELAARGAKLCRRWEELPQVTIAAIEGSAIGASVALALACDWRIASRSSVMHLPEVRIGLNMGWGAIPRLISLIGPARTKRMILLAKRIEMDTAETWGLVDFVAEPGQVLDGARALADDLLQAPGVQIRMTKEAVNLNTNAGHRMGIYMDVDQGLVCRDSAEARLARSAFSGRTKK